ncbi:aminoacrylate peracid reductase [Methylacidimicrobium cyclopophantes]|uniref:Aminoacrylate peracid reductase n=1 Tax=Methylacidimicrobium cyclopophantes TaxID=1041766 RepID=A0A5E6M9Y1_9BACT|nr:Rid family detoxifying hydrolase [Methylacidimicrobium cyclopophantes]VVM06352.1 aminoacrylate peracid reductase [Methylacidimicrobium cyclopophantes]
MSSKKALFPSGFPAPIGPYSPGIAAGELCFVSGQLPLGPDGGSIPQGIEQQTEQAIRNLESVLAAEGLTLAHVVKTSVFLADLDDFPAMNGVYARFFPEPRPARSVVEVSRLPRGSRIEIEAIARR